MRIYRSNRAPEDKNVLWFNPTYGNNLYWFSPKGWHPVNNNMEQDNDITSLSNTLEKTGKDLTTLQAKFSDLNKLYSYSNSSGQISIKRQQPEGKTTDFLKIRDTSTGIVQMELKPWLNIKSRPDNIQEVGTFTFGKKDFKISSDYDSFRLTRTFHKLTPEMMELTGFTNTSEEGYFDINRSSEQGFELDNWCFGKHDQYYRTTVHFPGANYEEPFSIISTISDKLKYSESKMGYQFKIEADNRYPYFRILAQNKEYKSGYQNVQANQNGIDFSYEAFSLIYDNSSLLKQSQGATELETIIGVSPRSVERYYTRMSDPYNSNWFTHESLKPNEVKYFGYDGITRLRIPQNDLNTEEAIPKWYVDKSIQTVKEIEIPYDRFVSVITSENKMAWSDYNLTLLDEGDNHPYKSLPLVLRFKSVSPDGKTYSFNLYKGVIRTYTIDESGDNTTETSNEYYSIPLIFNPLTTDPVNLQATFSINEDYSGSVILMQYYPKPASVNYPGAVLKAEFNMDLHTLTPIENITTLEEAVTELKKLSSAVIGLRNSLYDAGICNNKYSVSGGAPDN